MTCADARRELLTRSIRDFDELPHLAHCAACRELARTLTQQEQAMYAAITDWVDKPRAEARMPPRRALSQAGPLLLVLAAAGALWLTVGGPEGNSPSAPPTHLTPMPLAPPKVQMDAIEVNAGSGIVMSVPSTVASVTLDKAVADYRLLGEDKLTVHVLGVAQGKTSLTIELVGRDKPLVYQLEVIPPRQEIAPEDREHALTLKVGEELTLVVKTGPVAVSSSNPGVVTAQETAADKVQLRAVAPGVTDVVVAVPKGPPLVYPVQVTSL